MVTKRKPRKQNNEQGASAKPARPSVKGKTVARPEVRPNSGAQETKAAGAQPGASRPAGAAGAQKPAEQHKPKRRIAMPQSSSRLKQNQATRGEGSKAAADAPAPTAADASASAQVPSSASGKPTPRRRVKSFPVAKAEKTAGEEAEKLADKVSRADVAAAEDSARASLAADAAKRRLERRQRKLQHQADSGDSTSAAASQQEKPGKHSFSLPHVGKGGKAGLGTADADAAQAAADQAEATEQNAPRARRRHAVHISWPVGVALAVLAIVVVVVAVFSWGRWARYDDAADFQGMWYANGTTSIVTVDGEKIHLTDDVAYNYTLDTGAKTITFTFGQMEGHGRYRFSVDRSELVITDGNDFTFWGNLFDDIAWQLGQAISSLQGNEIGREAVVDGVTVLDRTQTQGAAALPEGGQQAADADAESADENGSTDGSGGEDAGVSAGETSDSLADGTQDDTAQDDASDVGDESFTGAVAEGGIESAGSNAVTLEQLKSGSL